MTLPPSQFAPAFIAQQKVGYHGDSEMSNTDIPDNDQSSLHCVLLLEHATSLTRATTGGAGAVTQTIPPTTVTLFLPIFY